MYGFGFPNTTINNIDLSTPGVKVIYMKFNKIDWSSIFPMRIVVCGEETIQASVGSLNYNVNVTNANLTIDLNGTFVVTKTNTEVPQGHCEFLGYRICSEQSCLAPQNTLTTSAGMVVSISETNSSLTAAASVVSSNSTIYIQGITNGYKTAVLPLNLNRPSCKNEIVSLEIENDKVERSYNLNLSALKPTVVLTPAEVFAKFKVSDPYCPLSKFWKQATLPSFVELNSENGLSVFESQIVS